MGRRLRRWTGRCEGGQEGVKMDREGYRKAKGRV
jgi:hypothetical protein